MPIINELEKHIHAAVAATAVATKHEGDRLNDTTLWRRPRPRRRSHRRQCRSHSITFAIRHVKKLILFAFRHITLNMHVEPMYTQPVDWMEEEWREETREDILWWTRAN